MKMTWVAVGDANTCPDCMERHGETHTEEEWQQTYGEPRSVLADTACGRRCRCVLAPAVVEAEMSQEEKQALEAAEQCELARCAFEAADAHLCFAR